MESQYQNNLGFWGWLGGGRFGPDRYAFSLHRLTGLGILAYFIMHIFVTGSRLGGPVQWEKRMAFFGNPIFKFAEFLVFLAFAFHALNGIRLVFVELGYMLGRPGLPAYPYGYSALRQKPLLVAVMVVAAALMIIGSTDLYLMR